MTLDVDGPVTQRAVLDALEARYPMLRGTIRDHVTQQRRPFVRFFACEEDLSHELAGRAAARRGRDRGRAVPGRRRDGRRLAGDMDCSSETQQPPISWNPASHKHEKHSSQC